MNAYYDPELVKRIEKSEEFKKIKEKLVGKRIIDVKIIDRNEVCRPLEPGVDESGFTCLNVLIILEGGTQLLFECTEWGTITIEDKKPNTN